MRTAMEILFWVAAGLILWTQLGYAAALWLLARVSRARHAILGGRRAAAQGVAPLHSPGRGCLSKENGVSASLVIAAHNEQSVIAAKVQNALELDYPRDLLEIVVACDGCTDSTAERARAAGADTVLELRRGGKIAAQDAAVARSRADVVAFSDANSLWAADALATLVGAFEDPAVGYACGQVRFTQGAAGPHATNQEGAYWRYEMAVRRLESELASITAGNGAIYATRRSAYVNVDPVMGHDLSLPYRMVKSGLRAVYVPRARATEKMVPSIEGELRRKRRMMAHTWAIVLRGGMLSPRGYTPTYWLMILTHRLLRYVTPLLHAIALGANAAALALGAGTLYAVTLCLQLALLAAAGLGGAIRLRPLLIARYYVLITASLAAGLWDYLLHGVSASWEAAEGTR